MMGGRQQKEQVAAKMESSSSPPPFSVISGLLSLYMIAGSEATNTFRSLWHVDFLSGALSSFPRSREKYPLSQVQEEDLLQDNRK